MLLGIVSFLSATVAAVVCSLTEAFHSGAFVWLLPASYLGAFLVFGALAYGFLLAACAFVDPDKPRERDSRFFRTLAVWYIEAVLMLLPVKVRTHGLEKTPGSGRFLLVCNHLHEIDPAILLYYFRKSQLAFVSKQENRDMPIVGKVMPMLLCPLINRENNREALKTILRCIDLLKEDKVSVGIFPEGYICSQRKLQHFRPGVFKIAQKAKVPIVVCTIRNTHNVMKNVVKLRHSTVDLHLLDVIPPQELEGVTTTQIADRIYRMMADDLGPENVLCYPEENT